MISAAQQIEHWPIDKLIFYARNPRKNDAVVDRMCSSIREFWFKIPVLARSDGEVVDGHLRLKAARKLGSWPGGDTSAIPVILCDEWSEAQVRYLLNKPGWSDRFPRRTEIHRLGSVFDQVRQGGHLPRSEEHTSE